MKRLLRLLSNTPGIGDFFDKRASPKPRSESKGDALLEVARVVLPGAASTLNGVTSAIGRFVALSLFYSKILDTLLLACVWGFCLYWMCQRTQVSSALLPEHKTFEYRHSTSRRLASKVALVLLPLFIGVNLWKLTPNVLKAYVSRDARSLCGYICNAATASALPETTVEILDEFGHRAADNDDTDMDGLVCFQLRGASFAPQTLRVQKSPNCAAPVDLKIDEVYQESDTGCPKRSVESFRGRVWAVSCKQ